MEKDKGKYKECLCDYVNHKVILNPDCPYTPQDTPEHPSHLGEAGGRCVKCAEIDTPEDNVEERLADYRESTPVEGVCPNGYKNRLMYEHPQCGRECMRGSQDTPRGVEYSYAHFNGKDYIGETTKKTKVYEIDTPKDSLEEREYFERIELRLLKMSTTTGSEKRGYIKELYEIIREMLAQAKKEGYEEGYKQGKFDAETTELYGEPIADEDFRQMKRQNIRLNQAIDNKFVQKQTAKEIVEMIRDMKWIERTEAVRHPELTGEITTREVDMDVLIAQIEKDYELDKN